VQRLEVRPSVLRARDAPQFSHRAFNADIICPLVPEVSPLPTFSLPLCGKKPFQNTLRVSIISSRLRLERNSQKRMTKN
jgi:hypothetical protein